MGEDLSRSVPSLPPAIESADLEWRDGQPVSKRFGDVYFSRENGLEETRYVFLAHNRLEERFQALPSGSTFVVAETGFGTGLNFLATWLAWREQAPNDAQLHFISVERFPLTRSDLRRALALWPELEPLADALLVEYPPLVAGTHRLIFDGGRVRLTLYFGEAREAWQSLSFQANAWFLDGFAPALNPDLWAETLIQSVAEHSQPGTTFATFTAVGAVRRALQAQGFTVRKVPGFGRKREMLSGELDSDSRLDAMTDAASADGEILVIGAGIAASLVARNLADRGRRVRVLSKGTGPADGASGNPQAALYVKLGVDYGPETQLALHALLHAQRTYARYDQQCASDGFWHPTGLLQLATTEQEVSRQARFLDRTDYPADVLRPVSAREAGELAGCPVDHGGLWFPASGWLAPAMVCSALLDHPGIICEFGCKVTGIAPRNDAWHVTDQRGRQWRADQVVMTGGHEVSDLLPGPAHYRFRAIRGQVTQLPAEALHDPNTVLCGQSYVNPGHQGYAVTGATFDLRDSDPEVRPSSHRENVEKLDSWLPGIWRDGVHPPIETLRGRTSFRCTTHDYQPVVGPVGAGPEGLFVLTGLGSKGFALAPLLAEWLVDRITGQPACLTAALTDRLTLSRCVSGTR
ncbi:bifunctional tRNA (5-methylaminomethyl-2-thiouridine)(34)-methyltransferase MnmD/FAD-dependent 5-carboxymethylaminomethyl-2-thiouridine(34) oxidoreductase MnmC [Marinobacter halodurans]|uniref:tRNA 5-methylaminomethyl-2-thiouridine biosynthesis bifunctional protein MnmC n=1 Tax=Marinobacter halodurans TaxID=2528979 RepID=A0ABY1ZSF0_9GAMM|nr:bifunctional tRNA (5-methylaminomethyl-2-thiouridine)(34)-methyltransferase MnmD/FAD-dependent 5-carboxymethylaminomethyl-2-thiouridine(34) oxidoreductase MnmC [Marinobacter halodurans]TBW59011.1 bifunctional tRNA (5-methylaminomethyl-2-thiouridine)(34)-methyltransferase MnmD/FAD-dependent 5-carboxymethylaminomethyl-2-thiouridine(34) oxidoreductase MnmC [Marinobacter halodurans]